MALIQDIIFDWLHQSILNEEVLNYLMNVDGGWERYLQGMMIDTSFRLNLNRPYWANMGINHYAVEAAVYQNPHQARRADFVLWCNQNATALQHNGERPTFAVVELKCQRVNQTPEQLLNAAMNDNPRNLGDIIKLQQNIHSPVNPPVNMQTVERTFVAVFRNHGNGGAIRNNCQQIHDRINQDINTFVQFIDDPIWQWNGKDLGYVAVFSIIQNNGE